MFFCPILTKQMDLKIIVHNNNKSWQYLFWPLAGPMSPWRQPFSSTNHWWDLLPASWLPLQKQGAVKGHQVLRARHLCVSQKVAHLSTMPFAITCFTLMRSSVLGIVACDVWVLSSSQVRLLGWYGFSPSQPYSGEAKLQWVEKWCSHMETLAGSAELLQEGAGDRQLQPVALDWVWHNVLRPAFLCITPAQAVAQWAPTRSGQTGEQPRWHAICFPSLTVWANHTSHMSSSTLVKPL